MILIAVECASIPIIADEMGTERRFAIPAVQGQILPSSLGSFQTLGCVVSAVPAEGSIEDLLGEGFEANSDFWEDSGRGSITFVIRSTQCL